MDEIIEAPSSTESVPNAMLESPAIDASAALSDGSASSTETSSSVKPSESLPMEALAPALPIDSVEPSMTIPTSSAGSVEAGNVLPVSDSTGSTTPASDTSADLPNVLPASTSGTPLESTPSAASVEGEEVPNAVASVADAASASATPSPAPSASPVAEPVSHPAHAFADQIHSLAFALEGSADSMIGRMGFEIRTLAASIKAIL